MELKSDRKLSFLILACLAAFLTILVGCSSGSNADAIDSESENVELQHYMIGDTVSTTDVEFTLTDVQFANKVGLASDDWLEPTHGTGGLVPSDGDIFVWMSLSAKNISKEEISGYDVTNIVIDYDDGYVYDRSVWTDGKYGWSTSKTTSSNVGLAAIMPLNSDDFYGYITCSSTVRDERDKPLLIKVALPSSDGIEEFVYEYALSEGADTSEEGLAVSEAFDDALEELGFAERNAGGTNGNGSRKFADEAIDRLRSSLSAVNTEYVNANLPEVAAALPGIQSNINEVADLLVDMGQTNSDENVPEIKRLCSETSATIQSLLDGELKAFN